MSTFFSMKDMRSYVRFWFHDPIGCITICTKSGRKLTSLDSLVSGFVICDIAELSIGRPFRSKSC